METVAIGVNAFLGTPTTDSKDLADSNAIRRSRAIRIAVENGDRASGKMVACRCCVRGVGESLAVAKTNGSGGHGVGGDQIRK